MTLLPHPAFPNSQRCFANPLFHSIYALELMNQVHVFGSLRSQAVRKFELGLAHVTIQWHCGITQTLTSRAAAEIGHGFPLCHLELFPQISQYQCVKMEHTNLIQVSHYVAFDPLPEIGLLTETP